MPMMPDTAVPYRHEVEIRWAQHAVERPAESPLEAPAAYYYDFVLPKLRRASFRARALCSRRSRK